jgi:EAL domain-containing protein (putative c-di-GMP-specific phosphodiesterase class I)
MAKALNMKVITEGVSTKEHVEFLTEAGCDIFQGFYYSMPIIVDEFEEKYL